MFFAGELNVAKPNRLSTVRKRRSVTEQLRSTIIWLPLLAVGVVPVLVYLNTGGAPEIRQAKNAVKAVLRHAENASFEGMEFKRSQGCVYGSFKAGNAVGGYGGARSFLYDVDTQEVGIGETNLRYLAMNNNCLRKALK